MVIRPSQVLHALVRASCGAAHLLVLALLVKGYGNSGCGSGPTSTEIAAVRFIYAVAWPTRHVPSRLYLFNGAAAELLEALPLRLGEWVQGGLGLWLSYQLWLAGLAAIVWVSRQAAPRLGIATGPP